MTSAADWAPCENGPLPEDKRRTGTPFSIVFRSCTDRTYRRKKKLFPNSSWPRSDRRWARRGLGGRGRSEIQSTEAKDIKRFSTVIDGTTNDDQNLMYLLFVALI